MNQSVPPNLWEQLQALQRARATASITFHMQHGRIRGCDVLQRFVAAEESEETKPPRRLDTVA